MKVKWFFCMVLAILLLLGVAMVLGARSQDAANPVQNYNLKAEQTFRGTVESKGCVVDGLLYLPVKTASGLIQVQVGPEEYFHFQKVELVPGDTVRILGARAVINERRVVLAREIRSARGILTLRDEKGSPLWEAKPNQLDPERPKSLDLICDLLPNRIK